MLPKVLKKQVSLENTFNKQTKDILAVFNENKLLILKTLYLCQKDICGCDLVKQLKLPNNLISYHVKTLRESGYIEEKRCGKQKIYTITSDKFKQVGQILKMLHLV